MNERLRLGILISGGGTTAEAVIIACQSGRLKMKPAVVISSREDAGGIEKAERLGVPTEVVRRRDYGDGEEFGEALLSVMGKRGVKVASQNGWLPLTPGNVVEEYLGWLVNQHPGSLDFGRPDFGGKGMYGSRVTCARVAYEWVIGEENPWTEATVHWVTEEYDKGGVIRVERMVLPVLGRPITIKELAKDPEELIRVTKEVQGRLLPIEHRNVIRALAMVARGGVKPLRRDDPLVPEGNRDILRQAKKLAIELFPRG